MGKVPPMPRAAGLPLVTIMRKPTPLPPDQQQQQQQTKPPPHSYHYPIADKKPRPQTQAASQNPNSPIIFTSPSLSQATKSLDSFLASYHGPRDLRLLNSVLQSFSTVAPLSDSIALLRHATKSNPDFIPNRSTYHILLAQYCKPTSTSTSTASSSPLDAVHQALNLMVADGCPPDRATTDVAVRSLCLANREDDAFQLVKELSLKHSPPDSYTYNFLVRRLLKSKSLSAVYDFMDQMRETFTVTPDLVTYTILIDHVCNAKNLREASRLLAILTQSGFKPDCFLYNTVMKGFCMLGQGSRAIEVYNDMKEQGVEPDLVTYNTLIFGLSKSGMLQQARRLLDVMTGKGHLPDTVTYTSLMNGLCREGNALGAMGLLVEMEAKGCCPSECTYNTLIHGLCKARLLEKGIKFYNLVKAGGMKLDAASYATLVRALCRHGKVAEAYEVFDYAVQSKSVRDDAAYSTLEGTLKWVKKAKEKGLAS